MPNEPLFRVYLCGGPSCTPRGGPALRAHLERALGDHRLEEAVEVRVSGCQDHCDYGPNLVIWPGPFRYVGLTPALITRIVAQHLRDGAPLTEHLATPAMRR